MKDEIKLTKLAKCAGCGAKVGAGILAQLLGDIRVHSDPNLLVGFDKSDDASVYKVSDELALVQTVDFFPPIADDPYVFGQIAATNALSDVYAMGGEVKTALNLVCFPESMDLNILGEILRGGAEKVAEAGGILAGGHSIADTGVKYGLSVTGLVDPRRLTANDTGKPGDKLILTKALGVGLICTANRVGEAAPGAMDAAVASMTTLNKSAAEISRSYDVHAATDVTGFSFLGHLCPVVSTAALCRSCRVRGRPLTTAFIPPPVSATETTPGLSSGSKMCRLPCRKFCSTPRPRADCCLPWLRKRLKASGTSCKKPASPHKSWEKSQRSRTPK